MNALTITPRQAFEVARLLDRTGDGIVYADAGIVTVLIDVYGVGSPNLALELDREAPARRRHVHRRAMLATLTFAGLRLGELLSLRWRDVDLAAGWLRVGEAKTDAGTRRVKIRGALRDELAALKARTDGDPAALVFPTSSGKPISPSNVRNRVLANTVKRANERLAEAREVPLPTGLTPHSLRRTFASLLYAIGEPAPVVMQELGHTHPGLALRIYAAAMRRDDDENGRLRALIDGGLGTSAHSLGNNSEADTLAVEASSRS